MLANHPAAVRPRPPAQIRRSGTAGSSLGSTGRNANDTASSFLNAHLAETLLGSEVSATYHVVGWDNDANIDSEDWLNEKSREELSELLFKATGLIKNRENELDRTSALCKSLYDDKVALQSKHQELLARIPRTPSQAPSSLPSPATTPLTHTPSQSFSGMSHSVSDSFPRRIRRISVSPRDISLLADQNAELMQKLEKLEAESNSAEVSGRRLLKKLEKEISLLKDELEKTQSELERTQSQANSGRDPERVADELAKKRLEREERVKALRAGSDVDETADDSIRDFAPGGPLSNIPSTVTFPTPPRDVPEPIQLDDSHMAIPEVSTDIWKTPPRRTSTELTAEEYKLSEPQLAVISQLLFKIQELEDTNATIIEQQKQTATKLQAVQRETENMSKVYECLSDLNGVKLELVEDSSFSSEGDDEMLADGENTIRFRSLKRTIENHDILSLSGGDISETDISPLNIMNSIRKPRKSVKDLFDSSFDPTPRENSPSPAVPFPSSGDGWSTHSPMPSLRGQSLKSELGSDYGDDWSLNAPSHHLRNTSLYDLSQLSLSFSPTPSRRTSLLTSPGADEIPQGVKTPVSNVLQLTLEPPTPPSARHQGGRSTPTDSGSLRVADMSQLSKQRRMSQTIRARASRWQDGRFAEHSPTESKMDLQKIFDEGAREVIGGPDSQPRLDDDDAENKQVAVTKTERQGIAKYVFELWLWLQFAVIILVFLYTMAKRGPKTILSEAERSRSALAKRR